jgi:hypothetical protein
MDVFKPLSLHAKAYNGDVVRIMAGHPALPISCRGQKESQRTP